MVSTSVLVDASTRSMEVGGAVASAAKASEDGAGSSHLQLQSLLAQQSQLQRNHQQQVSIIASSPPSQARNVPQVAAPAPSASPSTSSEVPTAGASASARSDPAAAASSGGGIESNTGVNQGQQQQGVARCYFCGTSATPLWRRDTSGKAVCNACGERCLSSNGGRLAALHPHVQAFGRFPRAKGKINADTLHLFCARPQAWLQYAGSIPSCNLWPCARSVPKRCAKAHPAPRRTLSRMDTSKGPSCPQSRPLPGLWKPAFIRRRTVWH